MAATLHIALVGYDNPVVITLPPQYSCKDIKFLSTMRGVLKDSAEVIDAIVIIPGEAP